MRTKDWLTIGLSGSFLILTSCASVDGSYGDYGNYASSGSYLPADYMQRLPQNIETGGKVIVVDPNVFAWGAYENGMLVKAGQATAGADWCNDIDAPCRTSAGTFRIFSLGEPDCKSSKFPVPNGGARMPYCMYFNGGQALHGSDEVVSANVSHGCVRMHEEDAAWVRYNFASVGTKVIVKPY